MKPILLACLALLMAPMALAQSYLIKPGDTLEITVLEDPSLNRQTLVLPDGRISVPLAGPVQAAGLSIEQVQANLARALQGNFAATPNVYISLAGLAPQGGGPVAPRTIDIYVLGEVAKPGAFTVEKGTNILQLMAIVGGPSRFAATKRIQLRRTNAKTGQESIANFNYDAIVRGRAAGGLGALQDGDVIVVPERRLFE